MIYPKLKYPINTKGMSDTDRNQVLAYDMIYRLNEHLAKMTLENAQSNKQVSDLNDLCHDIDANLANLGSYIEHHICKGNLALLFGEFETEETQQIELGILK